jgi:glutathione peroxidase-family protein
MISGFTPQYKGLQRLHDEYSDRGLVVIGFPCDQFGGQEPGNDQEIMEVRIPTPLCDVHALMLPA